MTKRAPNNVTGIDICIRYTGSPNAWMHSLSQRSETNPDRNRKRFHLENNSNSISHPTCRYMQIRLVVSTKRKMVTIVHIEKKGPDRSTCTRAQYWLLVNHDQCAHIRTHTLSFHPTSSSPFYRYTLLLPSCSLIATDDELCNHTSRSTTRLNIKATFFILDFDNFPTLNI